MKNEFFCYSIRLSLNLLAFLPVLTSCIHTHQDKYGTELNDQRKILGLPVIEANWRRDASIFYPAPEGYTLWFTACNPKDPSIPYHAYKAIWYTSEHLVAECDTYLNMEHNWRDAEDTDSCNCDSLEKTFAKYHALRVTYVYLPMRSDDKDFSSFLPGFHYEIQGEKDGYSDVQTLDQLKAGQILKCWGLSRLND